MTYLLFRLQVVESSSLLVSILFGEALNHPYISFLHLLVNVFSVIIIMIIIFIIINFFIRVFSEYTEALTTSLIAICAILPEICTFTSGVARGEVRGLEEKKRYT